MILYVIILKVLMVLDMITIFMGIAQNIIKILDIMKNVMVVIITFQSLMVVIIDLKIFQKKKLNIFIQ